MNPAQASIRHVRCTADVAAPARRALERWLAGLDLRRYGLPAQAILLVRQARAPLRALAADTANDPLAAALRGAMRPAVLGFAAAGAGAVWFADEAELLACLARDALGGSAAACWWWSLALGRTPSVEAAQQRWINTPRAVPTALHALQATAHARPWLQAFGPGGRQRLLPALGTAFPLGTRTLQAVAAADAGMPTRDAAPTIDAFLPTPAGSTRPALAPAAAATPPGDAIELWLRLCDTLRTEPLCAADERFVETLAQTRNRHDAVPLPSKAIALHPPDDRVAPTPPTPSPPAPLAAAPAAAPASRSTSGARALNAGPAMPTAAAQPAPAQQSAASAESPRAVAAPAPLPTSHAPFPKHRAPAQAPRTLPRAANTAIAPASTLESAFAGLFFLLNAAIALGLYGDFTQPRHRGLTLSPWRFLLDAGRAFFGRRFMADPLAPWLALRAPQHAVAAQPARWCLPAAALQAFAADTRCWHAVVTPQSLRLQHPAGFVAAADDAGLDALAALCADANLSPQQRHTLQLHHSGRTQGPPRDEWSALWPLLRARLALALGMPARPAAITLALALRGRLSASALRLDLHFNLGDLPLAVRLAGLDRDPGWLPAAGTDIRFHFD